MTDTEDHLDGLNKFIIYDQLSSMLFLSRVGEWRLRRYWIYTTLATCLNTSRYWVRNTTIARLILTHPSKSICPPPRTQHSELNPLETGSILAAHYATVVSQL